MAAVDLLTAEEIRALLGGARGAGAAVPPSAPSRLAPVTASLVPTPYEPIFKRAGTTAANIAATAPAAGAAAPSLAEVVALSAPSAAKAATPSFLERIKGLVGADATRVGVTGTGLQMASDLIERGQQIAAAEGGSRIAGAGLAAERSGQEALNRIKSFFGGGEATKQIPAVVPAASVPTTSATTVAEGPLTGQEAADASAFISGRGVPAYGTGYFRNERTGKVTAVGSPRARGVNAVRFATPEPALEAGLSRTGNPLADLVANNVGLSLVNAYETRGTKAAERVRKADLEQQKFGLEEANSLSDRLKAIAAFKAAGTKDVQKPFYALGLGDTVIKHDPNTNLTTKTTPQTIPTVREFIDQHKAANPGMKNKDDTPITTEQYQEAYKKFLQRHGAS